MFRFFCLSFIGIFVSACFDGPTRSIPVEFSRPDSYYTNLREKDKNRQTILEESRKTYRDSRICESEDYCEDMCSDIFTRRSDKKDCEALSVIQVEKIYDINEFLEDADIESLQDINLKDFKVFLNINPEPVEKHLKEIGSSKAKDLLYWIASEDDVASLFESEDEDYLILEAIFQELKRDVTDALQRRIHDGDLYHEVALLHNNEEALSWVHGYFEDKLCDEDDDDEADACLLTQYCLLDSSLHEDFSADILEDYRTLNKFLDRYIEEPPEDDLWEFDSLDDVDDLRGLCRGFCISNAEGEDC